MTLPVDVLNPLACSPKLLPLIPLAPTPARLPDVVRNLILLRSSSEEQRLCSFGRLVSGGNGSQGGGFGCVVNGNEGVVEDDEEVRRGLPIKSECESIVGIVIGSKRISMPETKDAGMLERSPGAVYRSILFGEVAECVYSVIQSLTKN
jgi:hypothetical protein